MAFERGSISCRFFHLPRALPKDAVERFARHAAPPLDSIAAGMVAGWVTGRHLLDRQITADTAFFGGWLRLVLLQAERKIPASLLHAECRMEELAQWAASGREFLNRQERAEIKRSVAARLLPKMPPQIKGIPLVHKPGEHTLYAGAGSAKQCDLLTARWLAALGYHLIPITPAVAALERKKVDVNDWHPASFSPDLDDADMTVQPGRDFLT